MCRASVLTADELLEFIGKNQGVSSAKIIADLRLESPGKLRSGKTRLYRMYKKLEGTDQVFWQKDGATLRWFAADYALENNIPDRSDGSDVRHRSNKAKYTPETMAMLERYNWINKLMSPNNRGCIS